MPGLNQPTRPVPSCCDSTRPSNRPRSRTGSGCSAATRRASRTGGAADDVIDIELQAVEGELLGQKNDLGDAVNANDVGFEKRFPYVAQPHSGSDVRGATKPGAKASGTADG